MRGRSCWFAIESKLFEVSVEEVRGKLKGIILERSRGFSSWIRFGELSLRNLLEGIEECCREEKEGRLVKVLEDEGGSLGWIGVLTGRGGSSCVMLSTWIQRVGVP